MGGRVGGGVELKIKPSQFLTKLKLKLKLSFAIKIQNYWALTSS